MRLRMTLTLACLSCVLGASGAWAQPSPGEAEVGRRAQSIARSVMSPFCPGKTIDACPSPDAGRWRRDIRRWVAEGDDPAEITARLQARKPDFDLAGRPGAGWDWSIPVGAMALVSVVLWMVTRRIRPRPDDERTADAAAAHDGATRDALDARLDAELQQP